MHLYYVSISVQSAYVRTTNSTIQLRNTLCNSAPNISHMAAFLRISELVYHSSVLRG